MSLREAGEVLTAEGRYYHLSVLLDIFLNVLSFEP